MCVNEVLQIIAMNKVNNSRTTILTLDLDAAYDFVDIQILSTKLGKYGVPEHETA